MRMAFRFEPWAQKRAIVQLTQEAYEAFYGEDSLGVYPTVKEAEKAIQSVLEAHVQSMKTNQRAWQ
jgi:hypothetical protein